MFLSMKKCTEKTELDNSWGNSSVGAILLVTGSISKENLILLMSFSKLNFLLLLLLFPACCLADKLYCGFVKADLKFSSTFF